VRYASFSKFAVLRVAQANPTAAQKIPLLAQLRPQLRGNVCAKPTLFSEYGTSEKATPYGPYYYHYLSLMELTELRHFRHKSQKVQKNGWIEPAFLTKLTYKVQGNGNKGRQKRRW
jgi:hypothetical protein